MANAQEWLESQEEYNTKEKRLQIKKLDINDKGLEGDLDLKDFDNLEEFNCSKNQLTKLDISNCSKISVLRCFGNELKKLDLRKSKNLIKLSCQNNQLSVLDLSNCENLEILKADNWEKDYKNFNELSDIGFLSQLPNPEKMRVISLHANKIESDLKPFSRFTNLEKLDLGLNGFSKDFTKQRGNRIYDSLEPLKDLKKLEELDIGNTDVDSGLKFLPDSIKRLSCSVKEGIESKVSVIREQLSSCNYDIKIWREWNKRGIDGLEIVRLTEAGVKIDDYDFVDYLKKKKYRISSINTEELEEKYQEYRQVKVWLDSRYSDAEKEKTIKLEISNKRLKGKLNLSEFVNLEILNCSNNELSDIDLSKNNKLRSLDLSNNKFSSQNLIFLVHLTELEKLNLRRNNFNGSLNFLKDFKNLKKLDISDTDIDSGWECLPSSIEEVNCLVKDRPDSKVKSIKEVLENYDNDIRKVKIYYLTEHGQKLEKEVSKLRESERLSALIYKLKKALDNENCLLLDRLGNFQQVKNKFLQKKLTAKEREDLNLVKEILEQIKVTEEKDSLSAERKRLAEIKSELENSLETAKNELENEELEIVLETLLETQTNVVKSENSSLERRSLERLKVSLSKKMNDEAIDKICEIQEKISRLEEITTLLEEVQEQQLQARQIVNQQN